MSKLFKITWGKGLKSTKWELIVRSFTSQSVSIADELNDVTDIQRGIEYFLKSYKKDTTGNIADSYKIEYHPDFKNITVYHQAAGSNIKRMIAIIDKIDSKICDKNSPTYPYCLPSHDDVNVYPLEEFWHNNKPYLYIGSENSPEGDKNWIYDVIDRKEIEIDSTDKNFNFFGATFEEQEIYFNGQWPEEYLNSLDKYLFTTKEEARSHGYNNLNPILLIFHFNNEWALFRFLSGVYKSVYLPSLTQINLPITKNNSMATATKKTPVGKGIKALLSDTPVPDNQNIQIIPLDKIKVDPHQPRNSYNEAGLAELTASIKEHGVIQAITLRRKGDDLFVVCGHRRYLASKAAGLTGIKSTILEMTDDAAIEIQITENLQREDVHPMDEAQGIARMLEMNLTMDQISTKIAKPVYYVQRRVKLLQLVDKAQKLFKDGKMEYSQAIQIARLEPADQEKVLANALKYSGVEKLILPSNELSSWIRSNIMLEFRNAPFALDDEILVPKAGSCNACPKRTKNNPGLFEDASKDDRCTDPGCFNDKKQTFLKEKLQKEKAKNENAAAGTIGAYDNGIVKVKGKDYKIVAKKEEGAIPVVITKDASYGVSKLGKTVYAVEKPKEKTSSGSSYNKNNEKAEELKRIDNLKRKTLFELVYAYLTGKGNLLPGFDEYIKKSIIDQNISGDNDSLAVLMGFAELKEGDFYFDVDYLPEVSDKVDEQLMKMPLVKMILLIQASDEASSEYGYRSLDENNDLVKVAGFCGIDWKEVTKNIGVPDKSTDKKAIKK